MTLRRLLLTCLLALALIAQGGCWDRRELESLGLVQVLGIDRGTSPGSIAVTVMLAVPPKLSGGGSGGGGGGGTEVGTFLISMEAPSIYEAFNRINTTVNREVTLLQNQVIIIGEDLARTGIGKWVDTLVRYREMRRTMSLMIAKGTASDIMKVKPELEKNPSEYFRDLLALAGRNGMFPDVDLSLFMQAYQAYAQENYLPLVETYQRKEGVSSEKDKPKEPSASPSPSPGGDQKKGPSPPPSPSPSPGGGEGGKDKGTEKPKPSIRLVGTAVFKKDKMVGALDIYETQCLLMVTGQFKEAILTLEDPKRKGYNLVFRLLETSRPRITYQHRGGEDRFKILIKLEADIASIQSGLDYTRPRMETFLGERAGAVLKGRIAKTIAKTQQETGADIFGLGTKVRRTFLTTADWNNYHWPDRFRRAKVQVDVKVAFRRIGVQFQPPKNF